MCKSVEEGREVGDEGCLLRQALVKAEAEGLRWPPVGTPLAWNARAANA